MVAKNIRGAFQAYVLIVDDIKSNRDMAACIIESFGCTTDIAESGHEALIKCEQIIYDIIFMDITMPGIDGYETTRRIRQLENGRKPQIIVGLSGSITNMETIQKCMQSGMNDCIAKPMTPAVVEPRFEAWKIKKIYQHSSTITSKSSTSSPVSGLF